MIEIAIDRGRIEEMAREAIEQRVKEIENTLYFMSMKQTLQYVSMSYNSFTDNIMADPNFTAAIRLGNKWLFNKKELDAYLDKFFVSVRDHNGGDIHKWKRRNA